MKCLGITCLGLILIAAVTAGVVYMNAETWSRQGFAFVAEQAATSLVDTFQLPEKEKQEAMVPIRKFLDGVRDGSVSLEQMGNVIAALMEGPTFAVFLGRAFEAKYLDSANLNEDEKKAARVTVTRFVQGSINEKIQQDTIDTVMDQISVQTVDAQGNTTRKLKDTLTDAELQKALEIMKTAADEAGVAEEQFDFNLKDEIQKAIDRGMTKKPGAQTAPIPTTDTSTTPPVRTRPRPRPGQSAQESNATETENQ